MIETGTNPRSTEGKGKINSAKEIRGDAHRRQHLGWFWISLQGREELLTLGRVNPHQVHHR